MNKAIITQMVTLLLGMVSPELLKKGVDALLDIIEDAVAGSKNTYDDAIVMPVVNLIRTTFDIEDNDNA